MYRALSIAVLSLFAVILATLFVFFNTGANCGPLDSLFESVSAFATVGLSVGATANMEPLAKAITMITMFVGRVGPVSLAISLAAPAKKAASTCCPRARSRWADACLGDGRLKDAAARTVFCPVGHGVYLPCHRAGRCHGVLF